MTNDLVGHSQEFVAIVTRPLRSGVRLRLYLFSERHKCYKRLLKYFEGRPGFSTTMDNTCYYNALKEFKLLYSPPELNMKPISATCFTLVSGNYSCSVAHPAKG